MPESPPGPDPVRAERARSGHARVEAGELAWANRTVVVLFAGLGLALLTWLGAISWPPLRVVGSTVLLLIPLIWVRRGWTRQRIRARYLVDWYDRAEARQQGQWDFEQDDGSAMLDRGHPFAADLDVLGPGSLFHRANSCHTPLGADALAERVTETTESATWTPEADARLVEERQDALREILGQPESREALEIELRGLAESGSRHTPEVLAARTRALVRWGAEPVADPAAGWERVAELLLPLVAVGGVVATLGFGQSWAFTLVPAAVNVFYARRFKDLDALTVRFEAVADTLSAWSRTLEVVSRLQFDAPLLRRALKPVLEDGGAPQAFQVLRRLAHRLAQRQNAYWALTGNLLLLSDVRARRGLLAWHRLHGPHLAGWMGAVAELEAQLALATFAEAQPASTWAEVETGGAFLDGAALSHALLPVASRVANDVRLTEGGELLVVTGSNMSGKSTYIRSVGLAVVMTRAGLPVPAARLRMRPMGVVTSMRVQDSLSDGLSRFHAEVRRLRFCLDSAEAPGSVLVLLDEILSGTNSRERHVGTEAVLRQLALRDAVTIVSTHDLSLASLADEPELSARVVHFTDEVREGQMTFDYRLREGVLPSTNALEVMRLEGLLVEPAPSGADEAPPPE